MRNLFASQCLYLRVALCYEQNRSTERTLHHFKGRELPPKKIMRNYFFTISLLKARASRKVVLTLSIDHNEKDGGCTFYQNALRSKMYKKANGRLLKDGHKVAG